MKVKNFDDYRKRLGEHFVILDRNERHDRIARELDAEGRRRGGRIARALVGQGMLEEVPDLVEYPVVASGSFAEEFLRLPEEVLTTTMIHHQHFFPIASDQGKLLPVFLAVLNMEPEHPEVIARNMERVLTARLRDAQFFFQSDRQQPLAEHQKRLDTVLFHKKIGTYLEKSEKCRSWRRTIAAGIFKKPEVAELAREAGRLCKADLATDMVRELTELQGTMGGIYAREDGRPEEVWKAIYFHYLPVGVEATAPPTREQLGKAAITWAAVSLADKLHTVTSMFAAGERPTGSRDPLRAAPRRPGHRPHPRGLAGADRSRSPVDARRPRESAFAGAARDDADEAFWSFMADRVRFVLEQRGYDPRNVRAVTHGGPAAVSPLVAKRKLETLPEFTESETSSSSRACSSASATLRRTWMRIAGSGGTLTEPAEIALAAEVDRLSPVVEAAVKRAPATGRRLRKRQRPARRSRSSLTM